MFARIRALISAHPNAGFRTAALVAIATLTIALSVAVSFPLSGPLPRPVEVYKVGILAGFIALAWVAWSLFGPERVKGKFRAATWMMLAATIFMVFSLCGMLALGFKRTTPLVDILIQTSGILTYAAAAVALFVLPARKMHAEKRLPWIFDVALIVTAISSAGWFFIIAPQVQINANPFSIWLTFAYPLANLMSIAAVVAAASLGGPFRSARGLLMLGIVLNVTGDVVQAVYMQRHVVMPAGLIFCVWIASTLVIGLAALQARRDVPPEVEKSRMRDQFGLARAVVPVIFLAALVMLALWGNAMRPNTSDVIGLNLGCVIAIICCLGRILCLIQDNADLGLSLETANESLEAKVLERTNQLSRAMDHLERQKHFLHSVIDALPSFVISQDAHGRVLLANDAAGRVFGENFIGWESTKSLLVSGLTVSGEQQISDVHGQLKTYDVVKTPVAGSDEVPEQVLVVGNDITVRKEAELSLVAARDAAEEASRVKNEFMAKMSHELRTPMNGVIGLTELLLSEDLSHAERELALGIRSSAETLQGIVTDVLDLANPNAARSLDRASLSDLCSGVVDHFRPRAAAKGVRLRADLDLDPEALFEIDTHKVRQIVWHLTSNAVKFTDSGCIRISVQTVRQALDIATVAFVIQDSGSGIAEGSLGRIFEPFSQGDNSMTRKHGGAGLGLSICRQFAHQLGGSISVDSKPGVGSTFRVELPLRCVGSALQLKPQHSVLGLRVLVAEDNVVNQMILKRQLERLGCTVVLANDGAEALTLAAQESPDLVLMDCQMPGMDGLEATRQLRRRGASVPVIAVTANAMPGDRERCIAAGMDDYLAKPLKIEELSSVLGRYAFRSAA